MKQPRPTIETRIGRRVRRLRQAHGLDWSMRWARYHPLSERSVDPGS